MAIIRVRRRMVPMTNRVRRVGCKKSVPNRKKSPPLKKKLLAERIQDELQESLTDYVMGLPTSHQKIRDERISDLEKEQKEVTAETDCSVESDSDLQDISLKQDTADNQFSAEGGDSDFKDVPLQHDTAGTYFSTERGVSDLQDLPLQHDTVGTYFSTEGGVSDLQDLPLQHNSADTLRFSDEEGDADLQDMPSQNSTAETYFSVEGGQSDLQDMPLQQDITETQFLAVGGDSDLLDMPLRHKTAETHFSAKKDNPELGDMPVQVQHGTAETHVSAEGRDSDSREISVQCDNAMTHFSAEGSESIESYAPDAYVQYGAAEGSNDIEGISEGVSPINKWACRVCMGAEVSIVILPCCHLCLCMDCELETDMCPVCGDDKRQCCLYLPLEHDITETQFLDEGGDYDLLDMPDLRDSDLLDMPLQHKTAETHFSAKGDTPELGDMPLQSSTAECPEQNCRVCMGTEVSIAILPCIHLCLCRECEPKTVKCPVCGGPKRRCLYMS